MDFNILLQSPEYGLVGDGYPDTPGSWATHGKTVNANRQFNRNQYLARIQRKIHRLLNAKLAIAEAKAEALNPAFASKMQRKRTRKAKKLENLRKQEEQKQMFEEGYLKLKSKAN
jgi:hypothetical protein